MADFRRQRSYFQQNSSRFGLGRGGRSGPGRKYSVDEEVIEIDAAKDVSENIREILVHLARNEGVSKARKIAYLNALVNYYRQLPEGSDKGFTDTELILSLRSCMLHKYSVVRAAAFRCIRYFIDTAHKVKTFFDCKLDWCLARSLDLNISHDIERTHAVRLCRHLLELNAAAVLPSIVLPFIALASDYSKPNERMVLMALEFLCEIAYKNSSLLAQCGGVQVIIQYVMQCHNSSRINESLVQTILYLLNSPATRAQCSPLNGLDQFLAPFTDSHYRHIHDGGGDNVSERAEQKAEKLQEDRLLRCHACSQALLSALQTWPGLVSLSNPHNTAISSLVNSLQMSSHATQKIILQLTYNVFHLRLPKWTSDFAEALLSYDSSTPEFAWRLQEGFVAAECLAVHKEKCSRPNLIDNHLALLLSAFTAYGMLEALCEVVIRSDSHNSIWATILLGELLHISYQLLPWFDSEQTHYLPALVAASNSLTHTREQRLQAHQAVEYLDRLHSLKKRTKGRYSVHLELLISYIPDNKVRGFKTGQKLKSTKSKLEQYLPQETEDSLLQLIKESLVLVEQNHYQWHWVIIDTILKSSVHTLRKVDDFVLHRFLAKLLLFYSPSVDKGFCTVKLDDSKARLFTSTGLLLLEKILALNAEESHRHLKSLLNDICHSLSEIRQEVPEQEAKLGPNFIYSHCCQNYFLFIGKLSQNADGQLLLEQTGVLQQLLDLVTITSQEVYVKLTVSSLDYTKEGICRLILSKALTATSENARLYTADFLRALLRLRVPFFSNWCMELLIKQLYDQSKNVSMRSLSVINEACEDQANLLSLIAIRPSVLHLGEMGSLLVTRYLSVQEGFKFLKSSSYIDKELERWQESFNVQYSNIVDDLLAESLSSYEKSYDDEVQRRSSAVRRLGKSVYVPPHIYGQLIQHSEGAEIVANLPYLYQYFDLIHTHCLCEDIDIKKCKAAIWATGHIGSSIFGLAILDKQGVIPPLINIAERSSILTLRGTAYYALGLIASTQGGVHRLAELGWRSVMNHRSEEWPVISNQLLYSNPDVMREIRSFSQLSFRSQSSGKSDSTTDTDSSRCDVDEGARSRTSTDERAENLRNELNGHIYQESTDGGEDFESAVRSGKAHSTSELMKSKTQRTTVSVALGVSHRRCSSDSARTWHIDDVSTMLVEDERFSGATNSHSSAIKMSDSHFSLHSESPRRADSADGLSESSTSPEQQEQQRQQQGRQQASPVKSAIRHKACKSLVEMGLDPPVTKSRSLSWRSDVRESSTGLSSRVNAAAESSVSSRVSSTDSAISQTSSISPIETGKLVASTAVDYNTMSLTRDTEKGKALRRKTRFSSLQSYLNRQDNTRGSYIRQRDELGQAAVRAMRRQASSSSSTDLNVVTGGQISPGPPAIASKSSRMIKNLSLQGDIDTLTEARKISSVDQSITSSTVRYMGLALPLDVIAMFEVSDSLSDCEDDKPMIEPPDRLESAKYGLDGLELHSPSNCIACVARVQNHKDPIEVRASDSISDPDSHIKLKCLERYLDGKVSETTPISRVRKECIKFITTICSSIGVNAAEEGLLRLKEQFPDLFEDVCLYSEVSAILSKYSFHLPARRFIQDLFQETRFDTIYEEMRKNLNINLQAPCCEKHSVRRESIADIAGE